LKVLNIAFDLDGVLVDIMKCFDRIIWEEYQTIQLPVNQFETKTDPYLDEDTIWECIQQAMHRVDEITIYPGATELLEKLYDLTGEPVKIITARHPKSLANVTHKLISERLCTVPYELTLVANGSKAPYLRRYDFMVEDRRRTAFELANLDKKVYLINAYYNQPNKVYPKDHPLIKRISGIHELIPHAEDFVKEI